jgi:hypothetical protein
LRSDDETSKHVPDSAEKTVRDIYRYRATQRHRSDVTRHLNDRRAIETI